MARTSEPRVRQDNLSHTLTVRVSPLLRDELAAAAEREDITAGELTRRSLRLGLDDADARSMNQHAPLPRSERRGPAVSGRAQALCEFGEAGQTKTRLLPLPSR